MARRDYCRTVASTICWILCFSMLTYGEEGDPVLYGSDQALGDILTAGGRRTFLDRNVALGAGTVLSFVAYIPDLVGVAHVEEVPLAVRFQVWAAGDEDDVYVLKGEKRVELRDDEGNTRMEFALTEAELVGVTAGDRIGFACEQEVCPISYEALLEYDTIYRSVTGSDFPTVGKSYSFSNSFTYPARFAFGAYVGTAQFGSIKYRGNPLVAGSQLEGNGQRAWIDKTAALSLGLVSKLEFYAAQVQGTDVTVYAQVWYPAQGDGDGYVLLWQREVPVNEGEGKYTVEIPGYESVVVNSSCYLGWTFPGIEAPIYSNFDTTHSSQVYTLPDASMPSYQLPAVGQTYAFDISFPMRFSIGMWIDTAVAALPDPPVTSLTSTDSTDLTEVPQQIGGSTGAATKLVGVTAATLLWMLVSGHALST